MKKREIKYPIELVVSLLCVKRCPLNAKAITSEPYKNMQNMLITNFAHNKKEPEICS